MFKKGQSGNPSGRPSGASGLSAYIKAHTKDFKYLAMWMIEIAEDDNKEPSDRINAIKWLADRGLGRVQEVQDGNGLDSLRKLMFVPKVQFELVKDATAEITQETQSVEKLDTPTASPDAPVRTISPQDDPQVKP